MSLHAKVFNSFDDEFDGDERQVMVFLAGLGQDILANGGMELVSAASNVVHKYTMSDLNGADKKKKAVAEVRQAVGDDASDTAIDSAIQAALSNYRAMKAGQ